MGFKTVTEMPGDKTTKENIDMFYTRYKWASKFVQGKDVLEVGCGGGQGLGYLTKTAKRIVGGDIDEEILKFPRDYYKNRIELLQFDAHHFPFKHNSFDVVMLFETIYYLKEPEKFLKECQRVLRKNGLVLLSTTNKDWSGFNPSPFSYKYFSVPKLANLFKEYNFEPRIFGVFSGQASLIRKIAVRFHLIPKTMKGKEKLKRLFFGKLFSLPVEVKEGMADYYKPVPIDSNSSKQYKVLFVLAKKC